MSRTGEMGVVPFSRPKRRFMLKNMLSWIGLLVGVALLTTTLPQRAAAQDQDDPPGRVARLGYPLRGFDSIGWILKQQTPLQGLPHRRF